MGGLLAEPAKTLPGLFGEDAIFGFSLFRDYPFALPSLISAFSLGIATMIVFLFLEEVRTLPTNPLMLSTNLNKTYWES